MCEGLEPARRILGMDVCASLKKLPGGGFTALAACSVQWPMYGMLQKLPFSLTAPSSTRWPAPLGDQEPEEAQAQEVV